MSNVLSCSRWLVVEKGQKHWQGLRVDRMTAKKPSVGARQVAIKVELALPVSLFVEPQIVARIAFDADAAQEEISAETVAGVESALLGAGFTVHVAKMEEQKP
jgi:hypothetical protein